MPNWCYNKLTLTSLEHTKYTGEGTQLQTLVSNIIEDGFGADVPIPKDQEHELGEVGARNQLWGTKTNPIELNCVYAEDTEAELYFDTAWGPPEEWVEAVSEKYDKIRFDLVYEEPNMDFCGKIILQEKNKEAERIEASLRDSSKDNIENLLKIFPKEQIVENLIDDYDCIHGKDLELSLGVVYPFDYVHEGEVEALQEVFKMVYEEEPEEV